MKKIIPILLFISFYSIACESSYISYFKEFTESFSRSTISVSQYSRLSSYKVNPELFIDFGKSPPDSFGENDTINSNLIFNGETSKKYFIIFVNNILLKGGVLNENAKKVFNDKSGDYSFEAKIKNNKLVIFENMLISAPDDMAAELSCTYTFGSVNDRKLMLNDVFCAG